MRINFGALFFVIAWTTLLGSCSSLEQPKFSQEKVLPIDRLVEVDGEDQSTDDQEVFLLEQQTQEDEVVDSGSVRRDGLDEVPEESPNN
jgi:hypothetical protein